MYAYSNLRVNSHINPIGYRFDSLVFTWIVDKALSIDDSILIRVSKDVEFREILLCEEVVASLYKHNAQMYLEPRTRYYWQILSMDNKVISEKAFFETGKLGEKWFAKWIGTKEVERMPKFYKEVLVQKEIKNARMYVYGQGLYEVYLNGDHIGNEYLTPGYHSYDLIEQYQTYDIKEYVKQGSNKFEAVLGEGWYKGRFGFDGNYKDIYGNQKQLLIEVHIEYIDGSSEIVVTDSSWKAVESNIYSNGIYDGEILDETNECCELEVTEIKKNYDKLIERINKPISKVDSIVPSIVKHSDGYILLDFGRIITGWVEFSGKFTRSQRIKLTYGELLQNGEFYRDNLRTAKSEFIYISDGTSKTIRPHFTFFGFRYVKLEGADIGDLDEVLAYQLMSKLEETGSIKTSNAKVNQLFANTINSQKTNFLDIPTDCPQRDERMGWTGDVAIFAGTACFHLDSAAFFDNYLENLKLEQRLTKGAVPFFVPRPKIKHHEGINPFYLGQGGTVWADVATILPWTLYEYYGNKEMLSRHYEIMTSWVDYITSRSSENKVKYLWQNDRQLGDWLALDNGNVNNPIGKTDSNFIASAYYFLSADLTAKAAKVIGSERESEFFDLKNNIKLAFINEYYDVNGHLTIEPTQTACAIVLSYSLYPEGSKEYICDLLKTLLNENNNHLNTGFVGTPLLCKALSDNGLNDLAYQLLLNEDYPGWLYEVNLGATTVWERWNSLLEDGTISGTDMNSMNHYAYGSIAEWMYRYMCGFNPHMQEDIKMVIKPMPNNRISEVSGFWSSPYGEYKVSWKFVSDDEILYDIRIPYNANAKVIIGEKEILLGHGDYKFDHHGELK